MGAPGRSPAAGDWLSGRAPRSHRGGHWFDPSIAHRCKASSEAPRTALILRVGWELSPYWEKFGRLPSPAGCPTPVREGNRIDRVGRADKADTALARKVSRAAARRVVGMLVITGVFRLLVRWQQLTGDYPAAAIPADQLLCVLSVPSLILSVKRDAKANTHISQGPDGTKSRTGRLRTQL